MVGEIVKANGVELLVLDESKEHVFVIALDTGIQSIFSESSNDYNKSELKKNIEKWLDNIGLEVTIERFVDLLTLDGYKGYTSSYMKVAPLTIDEYRKYANIIIPHIKNPFWLATGWDRPDSYYGTTSACYVYGDGRPYHYDYSYSVCVAPAFIIKTELLDK